MLTFLNLSPFLIALQIYRLLKYIFSLQSTKCIQQIQQKPIENVSYLIHLQNKSIYKVQSGQKDPDSKKINEKSTYASKNQLKLVFIIKVIRKIYKFIIQENPIISYKMRKNILCFTILALICLIPTLAVEFDINNAKYKRGSQFWNVDIPIINPAGSYSITYENLPVGWKIQGNSLSIPASVTKYQGNYPLKVSARSASGIVLRRTLLFKFSGSGLFLGDYPYDYNFQATQSSSSLSFQSSGSYVKNSQALSTQIISTKLLRSQYDALPSYSDLDKIIDTADIVLITKTIQSVVQSNLNCLAKMGYLSDFLGKIESYISIKGFRAKDLKQIIDTSKAQIAKLQLRITQYNTQVANLGIPALKIQLNRALAKLQLAYSEYNTANIDISPFQLKISNFNNEVRDVNVQITKATTQLNGDKSQITTLNAFIAELEDKLAKARVQRDNYSKRVIQTQDFLTKSLARVQQVQILIAELDLKIKNVLANKDKLKATSDNLQRQVDQIKNNIALSQKRQADIIGKITDLKIKISAQQLKLDRNQLDNIIEMILLLEGEVLTVRRKIDQLDLQCNGVINISVQVLDTKQILYTFNPTQFQSYFNGYYGVNAFTNFASYYKNVNSQNMSLYGYNIFSDKWSSLYGTPYLSDVQLAYSTGLITDYSFSSDFQCSNYQNLINLVGKINSINGNIILVNDSTGKSYELQLGACSRINGINQYAPSLGNQIAWRGVLDSGNRYFVHTATCY